MIAERILAESRILIVDDNPSNVMILERMLSWSGYSNVRSTYSPSKAISLFATFDPDLVILDLHMPTISGYEVLAELKSQAGRAFVPVLVFTADTSGAAREKALSLGASDFLTKPGDATEISLRVRNFLQTRHLNREIEVKNKELEDKVEQRTRALWTSQIEILDRLARASQLRQNIECERPGRMGEVCAEIARTLKWENARVEVIRLAAPLLDIGMLTTPDSVISKQGQPSSEDDATFQQHTISGAHILSGGRTPLLQMAEQIARSHHECWDGSGYPDGLSRDQIPIAARVAAVGNCYAELVAGSSHRKRCSIEEAIQVIVSKSGTKFDPAVVRALECAFQPPQQVRGRLSA